MIITNQPIAGTFISQIIPEPKDYNRNLPKTITDYNNLKKNQYR